MRAQAHKNIILVPDIYTYHGVAILLDSFCRARGLSCVYYPLRELKVSLENLSLTYRLKELTGNSDISLFLVPVSIKVDERLYSLFSERIHAFATPSTGTDHVDFLFLKEKQIPFFSAEGANADSVVEYVLSSLALVLEKDRWKQKDFSVGIIGFGRIGSALGKVLNDFGISVLALDPYVFPGSYEKDLENIRYATILTFHVPLTYEDLYPTFHSVDLDFLGKLKAEILINTARGKIFTEEAYSYALKNFTCIMDVFYEEPPKKEYLTSGNLRVATPHVAGYNWRSRIRGMVQVLRDYSTRFGISWDVDTGNLYPAKFEKEIYTSLLEETLLLKENHRSFSLREKYPARAGIAEQKYRSDWNPVQKELYEYFYEHSYRQSFLSPALKQE